MVAAGLLQGGCRLGAGWLQGAGPHGDEAAAWVGAVAREREEADVRAHVHDCRLPRGREGDTGLEVGVAWVSKAAGWATSAGPHGRTAASRRALSG